MMMTLFFFFTRQDHVPTKLMVMQTQAQFQQRKEEEKENVPKKRWKILSFFSSEMEKETSFPSAENGRVNKRENSPIRTRRKWENPRQRQAKNRNRISLFNQRFRGSSESSGAQFAGLSFFSQGFSLLLVSLALGFHVLFPGLEDHFEQFLVFVCMCVCLFMSTRIYSATEESTAAAACFPPKPTKEF